MSNKIKYIATANYGDSWSAPVTKYEQVNSDLIVSTIPINSNSTDYGAREFHAVIWRVGTEEPYSVYAGVKDVIGVVIPPEITSPSDGSEDVATDVTISWDKRGEGGTTTLQIATDANFSTLVVNETGIAGESHQVNLDYNTEYFARVKTVFNGDESEWSDAVTFTTITEEEEEPPPEPIPPSSPAPPSPSPEAPVVISTNLWPSVNLVKFAVYLRLTDSLNLPLSASGWVDVTDNATELPEIISQIEYDHGQFSADSIELEFADIKYFKESILSTDKRYIEVKITARSGTGEATLSDEQVLFSGIYDNIEGKEVGEYEDRVSMNFFSYDEHANRVSAERTVQKPTRDLSGTPPGLVLQNIPGIYVINAGMSGYELTRGFHTLEYKVEAEPGAAQRLVRLNDGRWVEIPSSPNTGTLTLGDAGEDDIDNGNYNDSIRVQVYYIRADQLTFTDDTVSQGLVQLQKGDTLPGVWYQRIWVFRLLEILVKQAGAIEYDFDDFRIATYDNRNETSYYEIPPGDEFVGSVNCLALVDGTHDLYMGIGRRVYKRNMDTHIYTELNSVFSNYQVVRIFTEIAQSHSELVILARNVVSSTEAHYALHVLNINTGAIVGYQLPARGAANDGPTGMQSFAYVKDPVTPANRGYIFYTGNDEDIKHFNLETKTETATGFGQPGTAIDLAGWSDGDAYYFQGRISGGVALYIVYWDDQNDVWWLEYLVDYMDEIENGVYNPNENRFIFSDVGGINLKSYNHADDTVTTILSGQGAANFDYRDGTVYFIHSQAGVQHPARVQNNSATIDNHVLRRPFATDAISGVNRMQFDTETEAWIGVYNFSNLLFQAAKHVTMYVEAEANFSDMFLRDAIYDLAMSYNITINLSADKKWIARRRIDDDGLLVTSGESISLNADDVRDITEGLIHGRGFNIVQVSNGIDTVSYDGAHFVDGGVFSFQDDRLLTVTRDYLPGYLLRDMAFYFYRYFSRPRRLVSVPGANISPFHIKPFDEAVLSFGDRRLNITESGVVVGVRTTDDGNVDLRIMLQQN